MPGRTSSATSLTEMFLHLAPDWFSALAVVVGAFYAVRGFSAWRSQILGQKKIELCEATIDSIYRTRRAIQHARNGISFEGEGETRDQNPGDSSDSAKRKNSYYVPVERLLKEEDEFRKLDSIRFRFAAYFQEDAEKIKVAIDDIFKIRSEIMLSAEFLINEVDDPIDPKNEQNAKAKLSWMQDIGWRARSRDEDHLEARLLKAVNTIENIVLPVLRHEKA